MTDPFYQQALAARQSMLAALESVSTNDGIAREVFRLWMDEGPKSAERMIVLATAALEEVERRSLGRAAKIADDFRNRAHRARQWHRRDDYRPGMLNREKYGRALASAVMARRISRSIRACIFSNNGVVR